MMNSGLRIPCEIAVKSVIPAIRVRVAKILYWKYRLTQIEISKMLGITQPAVNKYIYNKINNKILNLSRDKEIVRVSEIISKDLVEGKRAGLKDRICELCNKLLVSRCV